MDKRILRYAVGGGAISLFLCILLCMVLGGLLGDGAVSLIAYGVLFALPGIVVGCTCGLYYALKGGDKPEHP